MAGLSDKHLRALAQATQAACAGRPHKLEAALKRVRAQRVSPAAVDEALLQLHLFAGFPAMINAFWTWRKLSGRGPATKASRRSLSRGRSICRNIYAIDFERMIENMRRLHPAVADWIIADGYGKVMTRGGLTLRDREALAVAALVTVRAWRQLGPHLRALLRMGYTPADLKSLLGARLPML